MVKAVNLLCSFLALALKRSTKNKCHQEVVFLCYFILFLLLSVLLLSLKKGVVKAGKFHLTT